STSDVSGTVLGASSSTDTADSAPSSETTDTTPSSTGTTVETSAPPSPENLEASTPASPPAASQEVSNQSETPPVGMTEVHIIGTKYTDYFTDGTTITSYPGDPAIDSNLDKPNAPVPTHEGLTWVQTTGQNLYDTSSGDLEPGDYAVESNGKIIANQVF